MKSFTFQCRTPFFRVMSFLTLSLPLVLLMGLFSGQALAVCPASGFEDDDGNLSSEGSCLPPGEESSELDWNSFAPTVDWTPPPAAPYRVGNATASGWVFVGQEDDQVTTADTAFAGGVKQDANCAPLKDAKAPNKDDLERIYLSTKNVSGHTILNLAWVRIPQNTTSASAHVGFEFNQGDTPCIEGDEDGLVAREPGDMLVVYDFEGGTNAPVITLRRWLTDTGDPAQADFFTDPAEPCDVDSNNTPCWGDSKNLTALGFAEAGVNVGFSVLDGINPPPPNSENLADSEFGEAGIDLTDAGVFAPGECASFGTAFGVSRSSGNSGQAQMKDLVGPVDFTLANCGTVIVRKQTVPDGDAVTLFDFTTSVTTTPATTTSPFMLKDDGDKTIVNVNPGTGLTVAEDVGSLDGYELTDIDCSAGTVTPTGINLATGTVTFDITASDTLDCTYTNTALGEITVTKDVVNACDVSDGGSFTLFIDGPQAGTGDKTTETGGDGTTVTQSDVVAGNYGVGEENFTAANYLTSISGTGCTASAATTTVALGAGGSVNCTITNVRKPTVTVTKVVVGTTASVFDLLIAGNIEADNVGNNGSTGAVTINSAYNSSTEQFAAVTLSETLGNEDPVPSSGFDTFWTCDNLNGNRSGSGTSISIGPLEAGEDVSCTVVNTVIKLNECAIAPPS